MAVLHRRTLFPFASHQISEWLAKSVTGRRMLPPWTTLSLFSKPSDWEVRREPRNSGFHEVQTLGSFARIEIEHRFEDTDSGTWVDEQVTWDAPCGSLGRLAVKRSMHIDVANLLAFRHRRIADDLHRYAHTPPQTIAITGATGMVGRELTSFLEAGGHRVRRIVRQLPGGDDILWNPRTGEIDASSLDGIDAVVHLAGEPVSGRWTADKMARIRSSRVDGTTLLATTLASLPRPPSVMVSASACGFYGPVEQTRCTESHPPGAGFLGDVARAWEAAADPARDGGIRVNHPRIGLVLSPVGGALGSMLPAFRMGLGGPLGDGTQGVSWIHIDDLVGLLFQAIINPSLVGPINAVAPHPVTQREFAAALGRSLGRPAFLPTPAIAVRALLGPSADALALTGAFVVPERMQQESYRWSYPTIEHAFRWLLGTIHTDEPIPMPWDP